MSFKTTKTNGSLHKTMKRKRQVIVKSCYRCRLGWAVVVITGGGRDSGAHIVMRVVLI